MNRVGPKITIEISDTGYPITGNRSTDLRLKQLVDKLTEARFDRELRQWSHQNSGLLRTRQGIRPAISAELLPLLTVLGPWVMVRPEELFSGLLADWERELLMDSGSE